MDLVEDVAATIDRPDLQEVLVCISAAFLAKSEGLYLHTIKTTEKATRLAEAIALDKETIEAVSLCAFLHDVGKLYIKDAILEKPGDLSKREREIIKTHPIWSAEFIDKIPSLNNGIQKYVLLHHEEPDGQGYPYGLRLEQIPLVSRVVAVSDRFSALTHDRPYKKSYPKEIALNMLKPLINAFFPEHSSEVELCLLTNSRPRS